MRRILLFTTICGVALSLSCSDRLAAMQDLVKGTWALQSRRMPDGTTLTDPHIFGLLQWSPIDSRTAHVTLNVLLRPAGEESIFDYSAATYEISTSAITWKRHILIRKGYKSSFPEPIVYYNKEQSLKGKVSVEGNQLTISHEEGQTQVFKGDTMTTTVPGGFVDTWKRIR